MRRQLASAAMVAILGCAAPARAQIVNVLSEAPPDSPEGFGGRMAAAGSWLSGNVAQAALEGSLSLRYRHDRHLWLLVGSGAYGEVNGQRTVDRNLAHLRYRVNVVEPLQLEAFFQHDANQFRRRTTRIVFGAGPRVVLLDGPVMWLALGTAYMPELERLSEGDFADSGLIRWHHRVSTYLTATVRLNERLSLLSNLYLQPALDDVDNLRAFSDLAFQATIWRGLAVAFSHSLQLDTLPPDTVRPVDAARRVQLAWQW